MSSGNANLGVRLLKVFNEDVDTEVPLAQDFYRGC